MSASSPTSTTSTSSTLSTSSAFAPATSLRAVQISEPGAAPRLVEVAAAEPGPGAVRITVEACGVCHSDLLVGAGVLPGTSFPVTPGHEIAGHIDALGEGVEGRQVGDRVAVGWYGGSCGRCDACRDGDAILCRQLAVPGAAYPGGYADSIVVPAMALAAIPDELTAVEAAPLACAGVTVFNALRRSAARPGDTVAVLGLGGLGHLGVQFARAMGFRTIAIARGQEKKELAHRLGAAHYIDSTEGDVAGRLRALGAAKVVLATVTDAGAMSATVDGLGRRGELIIVGVSPDRLQLSGLQLLNGDRRVYAHSSGAALDTQDTLRFAAQTGVRAWTEEMRLEDTAAAVERMSSGKARFRMVLTTGH
ncbi:alcohol dehydrogenase catalytic domain-containing protein [Streptomyces telluris]|uniref:Alcohol dehydrogenase n=1 Tax=Streptomyces telluris TaxID=2720021 RepID=A0A9X2LN44_9ACTN|nr:alcohol dehydrogenase catalytic domain-containing protein [Streptomyces telluris]MCQ8774293.1 alcohol dehydrogenase catalytic domain-containing protein [Streptomyces telluris]NJP82465.1 alcohol dehydrogenase catalytic domain-containing protein [Streptomyces telluris]